MNYGTRGCCRAAGRLLGLRLSSGLTVSGLRKLQAVVFREG
jgi:hypothetical protein